MCRLKANFIITPSIYINIYWDSIHNFGSVYSSIIVRKIRKVHLRAIKNYVRFFYRKLYPVPWHQNRKRDFAVLVFWCLGLRTPGNHKTTATHSPRPPIPPTQERKEKSSGKLLNQKCYYPIYKVSGGKGRPTSDPVEKIHPQGCGCTTFKEEKQMIINHNIAALNTLNHLNAANNAQSKSMQKLSSGLRINSAADDAAGLAISEKMRSQIRGLDQASRNAQDGISLVQTAEGALNETTDILQRMRELSVQAANDTNTDDDRKEIQKEMNQLTSEVNRIGNTTEFNTQKLLDGTKAVSTSGATSGTAATSFTNATAMTPASDNSVTKHPTVQGKYTGTSDITLTVKYDHTNSKFQYSTDGDNWEDFTDNSATVDGITITTSDAGTSTTDDLIWTVDLKKATTGTPGTTSGSGITLQIGANQSQTFTVEINDMRAGALGISSAATDATGVNKDVTGAAFTTGSDNELTDKSGTATTEYALDVTDATKASAATKVIDEAIKTVSSERARLGAYENRLDHTVNNLSTSSENLTSAESRIRDVDYALAA